MTAFRALRNRAQHAVSPLWLNDGSKTLYCSTAIYNSNVCGRVTYECSDPTACALEKGVWVPPTRTATGEPLCCINDGQPLSDSDTAIPIPFAYDRDRKRFLVAKTACGVGCAKRWIYDRLQINGAASLSLLEQMAAEVFGIKSVPMSPPVDMLVHFGGSMSLAEYRRHGAAGGSFAAESLATHLAPYHILQEIRHAIVAQDSSAGAGAHTNAVLHEEEQQVVTRIHFPPKPIQEDPSRLVWNCDVLERPHGLPDDPVLPEYTGCTEFDEFFRGNGKDVAKAKRKGGKNRAAARQSLSLVATLSAPVHEDGDATKSPPSGSPEAALSALTVSDEALPRARKRSTPRQSGKKGRGASDEDGVVADVSGPDHRDDDEGRLEKSAKQRPRKKRRVTAAATADDTQSSGATWGPRDGHIIEAGGRPHSAGITSYFFPRQQHEQDFETESRKRATQTLTSTQALAGTSARETGLSSSTDLDLLPPSQLEIQSTPPTPRAQEREDTCDDRVGVRKLSKTRTSSGGGGGGGARVRSRKLQSVHFA